MNHYISDIIYCCEPFDRYHAFCDLQQLSQYNSGRCIVPERVLASRWMWSLGKVRRYLDDLQQHGVIEVTKATKQNIITVLDDSNSTAIVSDKEARAKAFCDLVNSEYDNISPEILDGFLAYWLDWSPRVNKFRYERTEGFNLSEKLSYWITKYNQFNNKSKTNQNGINVRPNAPRNSKDGSDAPITIDEIRSIGKTSTN